MCKIILKIFLKLFFMLLCVFSGFIVGVLILFIKNLISL
jgi:hypothetical protein